MNAQISKEKYFGYRCKDFFFLLRWGFFFELPLFFSVESAKALDAALESSFLSIGNSVKFKCLLGLKPKRELIELKPVGHLNRRFISVLSELSFWLRK